MSNLGRTLSYERLRWSRLAGARTVEPACLKTHTSCRSTTFPPVSDARFITRFGSVPHDCDLARFISAGSKCRICALNSAVFRHVSPEEVVQRQLARAGNGKGKWADRDVQRHWPSLRCTVPTEHPEVGSFGERCLNSWRGASRRTFCCFRIRIRREGGIYQTAISSGFDAEISDRTV